MTNKDQGKIKGGEQMIRVLIVDDHEMVRIGVSAYLLCPTGY